MTQKERIERIAALYKIYNETQAIGLTTIGSGDYGVEARFTNGQRHLVVLGIDTSDMAADFCAFLAYAAPSPKAPHIGEREKQELKGMWAVRERTSDLGERDIAAFFADTFGMHKAPDNLDARVPIVVGFAGYAVVAIVRTVVASDSLPSFQED